MKQPLFLYFLLLSSFLFGQTNHRKYIIDDAKAKALVKAVLKETPTVDGHNDLFVRYYGCFGCPRYTTYYCEECPRDIKDYPLDKATPGHTDIDRWHKGGVGGQLLNIGMIEPQSFDLLYRLQETYPEDLAVVGSAAQMRNAMKQGKIALLPTLEGATELKNDMRTLRMYYKLGLRSVTISYATNDLADGGGDTVRHNGLSPFGREMVKEMNRLGILVDLAHTSEKAMLDLIEASDAPVIISHSNLRALMESNRNISDQVLLRLKEKHGIIMLAFLPHYIGKESADWSKKVRPLYKDYLTQTNNDTVAAAKLIKKWMQENPEPRVSLSEVADQFDYVKRLIGINNIGIGSDFDGMPYGTVQGLEDVSTFPNLLVELARRGWTESELQKICNENFFRVFKAVEKTAQQKQRTTKPSLVKLEDVNKKRS